MNDDIVQNRDDLVRELDECVQLTKTFLFRLPVSDMSHIGDVHLYGFNVRARRQLMIGNVRFYIDGHIMLDTYPTSPLFGKMHMCDIEIGAKRFLFLRHWMPVSIDDLDEKWLTWIVSNMRMFVSTASHITCSFDADARNLVQSTLNNTPVI